MHLRLRDAFDSLCSVEDVPLHPWTQRFVDPEREAAYGIAVFEESVRPNVTAIVFSLVVTAVSLSVLDWFVVPDVRGLALTIRLGGIVPLFLGFAAFTRSPRFTPTTSLVSTVVGVGSIVAFFLAVGLAADPPGSWLYLVYPVIFSLGTPPLARWTVRTSAAFNTAVVVTATAAIVVVSPPQTVAFFAVITHIVSGVYGVIAAIYTERIARRSFVQREVIEVQRHRADALLFDILPASIAERLKDGELDIADAYDGVAVLFADIVGFTPMSDRLEPRVVVAALNGLFTAFDEVVERRGLEKIKTVGDAYMVAAGLPDARPDAARDAVDLAFELRDLVAGREGPEGKMEVRIGIHVGPLVAGVIGRRRFFYDVWGDTVNTAARMESHGAPGAIHVTQAVRDQVGDGYRFTARGNVAIKGKGEMPTYWVERA